MVSLETNHGSLSNAGSLPPADSSHRVCAAIDLGTNNCRLLIARGFPGGFRVIDAFSRIVRLGEGLTRNDQLSEAAMTRTLAALRVCSAKIRRRGASAVRAVATEACRHATNCHDFLALAEAQTGIGIEIISAREEGRLALLGCTPLLDPAYPFALLFDIGGGSTELMWLRVNPDGPPILIDHISVRRGVVSLSELYGADRLSPGHFAAMVDEIATDLAEFEARNGIRRALARGAVQMLGTSGTVTTLAGVHLGLVRYERARVDGSYLGADQVRAVIAGLLGLDCAARALLPCIGPERADLILAGCAVLQAILEVFPIGSLRIADRGLREGILAEMTGSFHPPAAEW